MARVIPLFYPNLPDDLHCLQSALKMTLDTLGQAITWEEADAAVRYIPGLYSWNICAAAYIASKVPGTRFFADLDYREFAARGEEYLAGYWRPEWYALQKRMSSPGFKREQEAARDFLAKGTFEHKQVFVRDLAALIAEGNLLVTLVDVNRLRRLPGSCGHTVLVYRVDGVEVRYHDPGLPPQQAARADKQTFEYALDKQDVIAVPMMATG